jgi:hypothetical protein
MADAVDSKSTARKGMTVQVRPPAPLPMLVIEPSTSSLRDEQNSDSLTPTARKRGLTGLTFTCGED